MGWASVGEVREALRRERYLADDALATAVYLAGAINQPLLLEGGRCGQDRGGPGRGGGVRRAAGAAAVPRGHRRPPRALRLGLLASAAGAARRGARRPGAGPLLAGLPRAPAAA